MSAPKHLQGKDFVTIDPIKLLQLFEWRDNNKELVRNFTPILTDVVILVGGLALHVKESTEGHWYTNTFAVYERDEIVFVVNWNRFTMKGKTSINRLPSSYKGTENDYSETIISTYSTLMAYMELHKEVATVKHRRVKKKPSKKKGKKKSNITYIRRVEYVLDGEIRENDERRPYTSPDHAYSVRGHWRTLKGGGRTWINGYTKNKESGEVKPKNYKL